MLNCWSLWLSPPPPSPISFGRTSIHPFPRSFIYMHVDLQKYSCMLHNCVISTITSLTFLLHIMSRNWLLLHIVYTMYWRGTCFIHQLSSDMQAVFDVGRAWQNENFPGRSQTSHYFLCNSLSEILNSQDFHPGCQISLEGAPQIPHFFPPWMLPNIFNASFQESKIQKWPLTLILIPNFTIDSNPDK